VLRPAPKSTALLLLLAMLLATQLLVVAHEAAHEVMAENEHCSICLRAGQYKASAPEVDRPAGPPTIAWQPATSATTSRAEGALNKRYARGPPDSLLA
jgi:hypothetical protein